MRINVSKFSEFCFGVKRAIRIANNTIKKGKKPAYSLGPIIHNKEVVNELSFKGLKVISGDLSKIKNGTIIICSHGVHPSAIADVSSRVSIVDATCPFVKNAQKIAKKLSSSGFKVIIVGDKGHPEVRTLKRFADNKAIVISNINEAKNCRLRLNKVGIIAQTTQSGREFGAIVDELLKKCFKEVRVYKTICRDADMRQRSTKEISAKSDLMIIVGGKNSANTRRLYAICKDAKKTAYHIESAAELDKIQLTDRKSVGIVSGASTPKWIVKEVIKGLKYKGKDGCKR